MHVRELTEADLQATIVAPVHRLALGEVPPIRLNLLTWLK